MNFGLFNSKEILLYLSSKEIKITNKLNNSFTPVRELEIYTIMDKEITSYKALFDKIIQAIDKTRVKAYKSLNQHQLSLNFEIGKLIVNSQEEQSWGKSIVDDSTHLSEQATKALKSEYNLDFLGITKPIS